MNLPGNPALLPLSALNDFLFCPRRVCLKFIEGLRGENEHTLLGDLAHAHVDFPGFEQRAGWKLLRALPLFSDRLGLSGRADLVEVEADASGRMLAARPVEYKKGPKRRFDNDDLYIARGSAGEVRSRLTLADRRPYLSNFKSEISDLLSLAESCSRQLRAWADSLQNSDIAGPRHLNDKTRADYGKRKAREAGATAFQQSLAQNLPFDHPLHPTRRRHRASGESQT